MNKKASEFIKNFSYTLSSNIVSLIVSTLVILIIPKLIGVEEYGYWQLYLFYSLYLGFLHFGWNDGIYLRYGGKEYEELNKPVFFSQFYMLVLLQLILAGIVIYFSIVFIVDSNRLFIFLMIAINLIITNSKSMLLLILQSTNRLKEFSKIILLEKVFYASLILILLILGIRDYKLLIAADLVGKLLSFFYSMYLCRDIVFKKFNQFYFDLKEAVENISVGIKLMIANIASMLIVGIVRFGIERGWDVITFAKVSLTLSISNFVLIFINTMGIVIFPVLRRTHEKQLPILYKTLRDSLMITLLGFLIFYYPIHLILSLWLPQYSESLIYMALLFPIIVFEGKTSLLITTYLKTLRKEKLILKVNLITFIISVFLTILTTHLLNNLTYAIISIPILLAFRSIIAEYYLSKYMGVMVRKDILLEISLISVFIISAWYIDSWITPVLYASIYLLYIFIKRHEIIITVKNLKNLVKA